MNMNGLQIFFLIMCVLQVISLGLLIARLRKDKRVLASIDNPTVIRLNSGDLRIGPKTLVDKYVEEGKGTHYGR